MIRRAILRAIARLLRIQVPPIEREEPDALRVGW
jgi:hypothetical protein